MAESTRRVVGWDAGNGLVFLWIGLGTMGTFLNTCSVSTDMKRQAVALERIAEALESASTSDESDLGTCPP